MQFRRVDPPPLPSDEVADLVELSARPDIVTLVDDVLARYKRREQITPDELRDVLLDVRNLARRQGAW